MDELSLLLPRAVMDVCTVPSSPAGAEHDFQVMVGLSSLQLLASAAQIPLAPTFFSQG